MLPLRTLGRTILFVTFVANLLGLALPYWMNYSFNILSVSSSVNLGLWQMCSHTSGSSKCVSFDTDNADWFKAVQGMSCVGFISITFALLLIIRTMRNCENVKSIELISSVLLILAAVCILVGVVVFGDKFHDIAPSTVGLSVNLHAAYYLCVLSILGSIVSAVLFLTDNARSGSYSQI